jgi:hypothetical protein
MIREEISSGAIVLDRIRITAHLDAIARSRALACRSQATRGPDA